MKTPAAEKNGPAIMAARMTAMPNEATARGVIRFIRKTCHRPPRRALI
jgi:hypothetical protein